LGEGNTYGMPAAEAAALRYQPVAAAPVATRTPARVVQTQGRIDYARIATELRHARVILDRIGPERRATPQTNGAAPRSPLERDLAVLWGDLLHIDAPGIHDNFFELGGHSLLAVQLLAQVRKIYSVDVSLEVVYSGDFTVAELAKAIELKEIE